MQLGKLAKCRSLTPKESDALFFPPPGGKKNKAETFCGGCPIITNCLQQVLLIGGPGFWAGTSELERARMTDFVAQLIVPEPKRVRHYNIIVTHTVNSLDYLVGPTEAEEAAMLEQ